MLLNSGVAGVEPDALGQRLRWRHLVESHHPVPCLVEVAEEVAEEVADDVAEDVAEDVADDVAEDVADDVAADEARGSSDEDGEWFHSSRRESTSNDRDSGMGV